MKTNIQIEVVPLAVPNKVEVIILGEKRHMELNFLSTSQLEELCKMFKEDIFAKAAKKES